jgi:hypothetical protein
MKLPCSYLDLLIQPKAVLIGLQWSAVTMPLHSPVIHSSYSDHDRQTVCRSARQLLAHNTWRSL